MSTCQLTGAVTRAGKPKHDLKPKGHYGHAKHDHKPMHEHKGHYGKPKHAKGHYGHAKPAKHEHKGHYGAFACTMFLASARGRPSCVHEPVCFDRWHSGLAVLALHQCPGSTELTPSFRAGKPKHEPKPAHEHKGHYGHAKHESKPMHEHKGHYGKPKHEPKPMHEHKGHYGHAKHEPKPKHEHKGHYGKPKHAKGHYGHAKPAKHEHKGHYGALTPAYHSWPVPQSVTSMHEPLSVRLQMTLCSSSQTSSVLQVPKKRFLQDDTPPLVCRQAQARAQAGARAQGPLRARQARP